MSQSELADAVDTDAGSISRWELGKGYPQAKQLARLAVALGESLDYLVLGATSTRGPTTMPAAFLAFLPTELGRIAQQRAYLPTLLSVRTTTEPTIQFYRALVAALMLGDDD